MLLAGRHHGSREISGNKRGLWWIYSSVVSKSVVLMLSHNEEAVVGESLRKGQS